MPITKRTFVDQIVIEPDIGTVLWRETTVIEEDGVELSRSYHRSSREADDEAPVPNEVKPYRALAATPAKVAAAKVRREEARRRPAQQVASTSTPQGAPNVS